MQGARNSGGDAAQRRVPAIKCRSDSGLTGQPGEQMGVE